MRYGLVLALVAALGCAQGGEVDDAVDGFDAGIDAGCGQVPDRGEVCPDFACHTCENQSKANCGSICLKHACWSCSAGVWTEEAVDCSPSCNCSGPVPVNGQPCPDLDCSACEHQSQESCPAICTAGECWRCGSSGWYPVTVACDSACAPADGGTADAS